MTAVVFDHLWQERLEHPKVRDQVDVDDFPDFVLSVLQEIMLRHNSSIIHQNCDISDLFQHLGAGFQNIFAVRYVNSENISLSFSLISAVFALAA